MNEPFKQTSCVMCFVKALNLVRLGFERWHLAITDQDQLTWPQVIQNEEILKLFDLMGIIDNDCIKHTFCIADAI